MATSNHLRSRVGRFFTGSSIKIIIVAAMLVSLASAWAWWYHAQNSPDRLFWGMVRNSLNTTGFARTVAQDEGQQSLVQVVQVRTSPHHLANGRSIITQGDPATTRVITESIGTPFLDFVRYTDIQTTQKGAAGNELDFTSIKNVWGKAEQQVGVTSGQLYNESVLGVIPMAGLSGAKQDALLRKMKESGAYTYELASVTRTGLLRRPSYTFQVQINPEAYITTLKAFADETGLTHLKAVDPGAYRSTQPVSIGLVVDGWSKQLTEVRYGGGSRVEKFSSFNAIKPLRDAPLEAIPIGELQTRLQTVQ